MKKTIVFLTDYKVRTIKYKAGQVVQLPVTLADWFILCKFAEEHKEKAAKKQKDKA